LRVALIGQPNCGKSTLFNAVAGYRSATGNFSGTTVRLTWSRVRVNGSQLELIDLPGIYSLTASSPADSAARKFLLGGNIGVIVNVLDASLLSRSLELTLELREMGIPMVVCLNMMDEAQRKGMSISSPKLSELLRLPVVETVAYRGVGVQELFAHVVLQRKRVPEPADTLHWHRDVESIIARLERRLASGDSLASLPPRFLAVKLLEGDEDLLPQTKREAHEAVQRLREELVRSHGRPADSVIMSERHDRAMDLCEQCTTVGRSHTDLRVALDSLLTHPILGYVCLLAVLAGFFWAVFELGGWIEGKLLGGLGAAFLSLSGGLGHQTLAFALVSSVWQGFAGGAAIVLPYLVPFLFGLALLEDIGYLPRVAYLLDGLLHRIGLHGTSVVPIMLGYGCSVPACLATRVLPSRRDRFLASVLATLVPCSARSTVIFALAAFYLGPGWALSIFAFNALVVFFSGWLLTRLWPEVSAGMILEVPRYQWPSLRLTARKVWLRLREFVVVSWPLLIGGSVLLGLAEFWRWDGYVNAGLSPLTKLLGLPASVGVTLIFGVLRKELSMVMLVQALGTTNVHTVLSTAQILAFTVFITFYIPCLATLVAMTREIGRKLTWLAAAYSLALATALGVLTRLLLLAAHVP
jgi:ferrous iron transport protein B